MSKSMNADRFHALIDSYGASPARWPEAERQAALDFLAADPAAQARIDQARALDAMLDCVTAVDHLRADLDQPAFEAAINRYAADFMPANNVVRFPSAAPPRAPRRRMSWAIVWGTSIGLAACLAGAALGVNLSLAGLSDVRAQTVLEQVAMIDTGD
ncbi:hypothetical protein AEAC466_02570 [Asticcacaulis sp. AC466]|uniref:hypothetical protein n=1 Tax=Asticcacaulis sp. AC466 TaxID=1282362 RepID=UPI0003C40374|nr:hypothetical protein [Asticcacaulis sp. AC466]ESQ86092.1 hypothetical protein AEAC466_02570 [Asticcacaulis sp. AC466]